MRVLVLGREQQEWFDEIEALGSMCFVTFMYFDIFLFFTKIV